MSKATRRLTDIKFEHEGAHVALVFAAQGGPANGVPTLITKSTADISDEDLGQLVELNKAKFNSDVRAELSEALRAKFASGYEWLYFMDFSETEILFESEAGYFTVGYSLSSDGQYSFDETAKGFSYEFIRVDNGQIKLSADAQSKLSEGEYVLVNKALNNPENSEHLDKLVVALTEKQNKMNEEIQKSFEVKDAEISALKADLEKALATVAQFEADKQEMVLKAREVQVSAVVSDGVQDIVKATAGLDDAAFATVLAAMSVQKAALAASDLMTEMSNPDALAVTPVNKTEEILKSKFAQAK